MIVVLATDHPDRDEWVDQQAQAEADRSGKQLPRYQGVLHIPPDMTPVHVFGDALTVAEIRRRWEAMSS